MYKLLIVDDEPFVRRGITTLVDFNQLQITEVYEADNGEEGLKLFLQHRPHLVLVDINMPKINGLEFAEKIKSQSPAVCIAIITGYDYFDYAVKALKIGVEDYILKPVSKNDVVEVLTKLIGKVESQNQQREVEKVVGNLLHDSGTEENTYKESIQNVIEQRYKNSTFSLGELAEALGLSMGYLSSLFKKLYGITFQEYILSQRLEQAKLLLLTTELKNYEVATAVGFEDPNYFSTRFKKQFGLSPQQYKGKVRGSI